MAESFNSDDVPADPGSRSLSPTEALRLAMGFHQSGRLEEAEGVYKALLDAAPDHAAARHYYGLLLHQRGDNQAALAQLDEAIRLSPDDPHIANNRANLLLILDQPEAAVPAYRRAIALRPGNAEAHGNLAMLLKRLGRIDEAVQAYRDGLTEVPDNAVFCQHLVDLLCSRDQYQDALPVARRWLVLQPDNPIAAHCCAALAGHDVPDRASDAFVKTSFDAFADDFDAALKALDYRAPALTGGLIAAMFGSGRGDLAVLDAGCGTGLCADYLRPYARHLAGVDLSGGMLAKARALSLYDELVEAELVGFLRERTGAYDLIVSADTLVYFGDLVLPTEAALAALKPGGTFVFTVELAVAASSAGFVLNPHGRYSHDRDYVQSVLEAAGFRDINLDLVVLRRERGRAVDGLLVAAVRPLC